MERSPCFAADEAAEGIFPLSASCGNLQGVQPETGDEQGVDEQPERFIRDDLRLRKVALRDLRRVAVKAFRRHEQRIVVGRDAAPAGVAEVDAAAEEAVEGPVRKLLVGGQQIQRGEELRRVALLAVAQQQPQGLHALSVGVVLPHGSGKALRQPHDSCGQARTVRKQLRDSLRVAHRTGFHTLGKAGAGQGGTAQLFDIFRPEDAGNVLRLILERVDIHGFAPLWI